MSLLIALLNFYFLQIEGETVETVADFILGGSKITADGDCSHEIKYACSLEKMLWLTSAAY